MFAIRVRVYHLGQSVSKEDSRQTRDREREGPLSPLRGLLCALRGDESCCSPLNSSLSKSSNGNWPMAKDYQIHFTPESQKTQGNVIQA